MHVDFWSTIKSAKGPQNTIAFGPRAAYAPIMLKIGQISLLLHRLRTPTFVAIIVHICRNGARKKN